MNRINMFRRGLAKWRRAAVPRRMAALMCMARATRLQPPAAGQRGPAPAPTALAANRPIIRIGEFVISPEGDPRILGHPQIRY